MTDEDRQFATLTIWFYLGRHCWVDFAQCEKHQLQLKTSSLNLNNDDFYDFITLFATQTSRSEI